MKLFDAEILSIKKCHECYRLAFMYPDDSFVKVCSFKHPVIWAKSEGFNYWPAKAMTFENNVISVRYFGDHEIDNIPIARCFAFSQNPPEKMLLREHERMLFDAYGTINKEWIYSDVNFSK